MEICQIIRKGIYVLFDWRNKLIKIDPVLILGVALIGIPLSHELHFNNLETFMFNSGLSMLLQFWKIEKKDKK